MLLDFNYSSKKYTCSVVERSVSNVSKITEWVDFSQNVYRWILSEMDYSNDFGDTDIRRRPTVAIVVWRLVSLLFLRSMCVVVCR